MNYPQCAAPQIRRHTMPDGYPCAVRVWEASRPRGQVVFVHGIISHGGWYGRSCSALSQAGLDVHFLDRRGSGLNLQARGDAVHYRQWLEDVESYVASLASDRPCVLLGVSWGGKQALALARRQPSRYAGLGLLCPGLFARQHASLVQRTALRAAGLAGLQSKRIRIPLQDPALFTDNPKWQEYIRTDPFTLREITLRFALADLELNCFATGSLASLPMPVLLMLAENDRIIHNERVRRFVQQSSSGELKIIDYPAAGHTLEFEPDPTGYIRDLTSWCVSTVEPSLGG